MERKNILWIWWKHFSPTLIYTELFDIVICPSHGVCITFGDGPETQGVMEDNTILRQTRGCRFRQFSLWFVLIGWDCGLVLTS